MWLIGDADKRGKYQMKAVIAAITRGSILAASIAFNSAQADLPKVIDWDEETAALHYELMFVANEITLKYSDYYRTAALLNKCGYPKIAETIYDAATKKVVKDNIEHHKGYIDIDHSSVVVSTAQKYQRAYFSGFAHGVFAVADSQLKASLCEDALTEKDGLK